MVDNDENDDLESIRDHIEQQNLNETDVERAIDWARKTLACFHANVEKITGENNHASLL